MNDHERINVLLLLIVAAWGAICMLAVAVGLLALRA